MKPATEKPSSRPQKPRIHPLAEVHPEAVIHPTAEIGPWCLVGSHVKIGAGTRLHSHVVVEGHTEIGEDNVFFPFTVVGAVPQDLKYGGEPTRAVIGNRNVIRESVTINIGTSGGGGVTRLGDDCLLMAYSHLGHDAEVGNHCVIANSSALAGHVKIEDFAILGGLTAVAQYVRVGKHAYVGGHSGLEKDIPPFCAVAGSRPKSLKGANIVGLRRRGFADSAIQAIHKAIKLWIRDGVERDVCLKEIDQTYGSSPEVAYFTDFIRRSETGVVR